MIQRPVRPQCQNYFLKHYSKVGSIYTTKTLLVRWPSKSIPTEGPVAFCCCFFLQVMGYSRLTNWFVPGWICLALFIDPIC